MTSYNVKLRCLDWSSSFKGGSVQLPSAPWGIGQASSIGWSPPWTQYCVASVANKQTTAVCKIWQYQLWSFKSGDTKLEIFLPENQHIQRKLLNFENWCSGELPKIGHHFNNKMIYKLMISKNVKQCAPKLVFFNEKKIQKDSIDIWHRKLTLKFKFWHFFSKFNNFLLVCWFSGNNLSNFVCITGLETP